MAVTKIWRVRGKADNVIDYAANPEKTAEADSEKELADIERVIGYIDDENKTEKHYYTTGINCDRETAKEEFNRIKTQYGKQGGIVAIHGYQSFEEEDLSPDTAHLIGVRLARELWGDRFQVVVSTHLNSGHIHNHFVINSISFLDGKRFHMCTDRYREMRTLSDRLCSEYELSVIENPAGKGVKPYLYKMEQAGMPTRYSVARNAIDDAISRSLTLDELRIELKQMGYQVQFNPNRKYWTVTLPGWKKPIRTYKLGSEYTNDRIIERLYENDSSVRTERLQRQYSLRGGRYCLPTRSDKIKTKSGLQKRYLRCLYEMGYLPKYRQNAQRVHRIFKDELLKCEMYSREAKLLSENNIVSEQDLYGFERTIQKKMASLEQKREELRKEVKRTISDEQKEKKRERIRELTMELREIRSQLKLCEDIKERSSVIEEKLTVIDKEKEQGRKVRV